MDTYTPDTYFDLSKFVYADIFSKEQFIWNVVKKIRPYLQTLFDSGKVKGNYAENVYIANSAYIDSSARISGPTIIGENVRIDFNAYIHGNVIIDSEAVIGTGSEIKNSILLNTCKASHFNYVSDSLLGNQVRLGVGAVITNKRVDRTNIIIKLPDGTKIDTDSKRFGAIIGDNTRVGANSVINPGTIIGKNSLIYPLESVYGVHKDGEVIK